MRLPHLFLELHADALFQLFLRYGEVVRIVPREPLGAVALDGPAVNDMITTVTVRCINDHGTVRFEAFSPADLAVATAWAEKHRRTTREEFDWRPFACSH